MRIVFVLGLAAALATGNGLAVTAPDLPPLPLRDKGKRPVTLVRQYDIPHEKRKGGFSGQICPMHFVDPYFGYLSTEEYGVQQKEPVSIQCYDSDNPKIMAGAPVRYDKETDQWVRDTGVRLWPDYFTAEERKATERSVKTYSITSVNSKGFAFTQDDINGEPRGRERYFSYCLFKPPKALCGHGQVGQLADPKTDLTAYALQIIRSIEFLDDAPVAATAASASASANRDSTPPAAP